VSGADRTESGLRTALIGVGKMLVCLDVVLVAVAAEQLVGGRQPARPQQTVPFAHTNWGTGADAA
jgi:hypothetical protein